MSRRALAMFLVLAALWGSSYLFIEVALADGLSPWAVVAARTVLAALVLLPLALHMRVLAALRGRLGPVIVLALVQVTAPLTLIAFGQEWIASSIAGILVSSSPIFTFLLAFALSGEERASRTRLAGVATGIVGVALLLGVDAGGGAEALAGGLLVIMAAFGYAVGAWYLKRNLGGLEPVATVTATQVAAAVILLPLGLLHMPESVPPLDTVGSLLALGVACTAIGFVLFHSLVASEGPASASLVAYVAPGFSVLYGVTLLDERFTAATAAGLLLILAGSWLAAGGELPARGGDVPAPREPHGGAEAALLEDGAERGDCVPA